MLGLIIFLQVDKEAGGFLVDDHSHWAQPYWIITKETFSLGRTEL